MITEKTAESLDIPNTYLEPIKLNTNNTDIGENIHPINDIRSICNNAQSNCSSNDASISFESNKITNIRDMKTQDVDLTNENKSIGDISEVNLDSTKEKIHDRQTLENMSNTTAEIAEFPNKNINSDDDSTDFEDNVTVCTISGSACGIAEGNHSSNDSLDFLFNTLNNLSTRTFSWLWH